jgi:hypothetical protein
LPEPNDIVYVKIDQDGILWSGVAYIHEDKDIWVEYLEDAAPINVHTWLEPIEITDKKRENPIDDLDPYYLKDGKWHCVECDKPMNLEITEIEKVISEVEDMRPYKEAGNRDSYSEYNEGWSDACDVLGQAILSKLKGE